MAVYKVGEYSILYDRFDPCEPEIASEPIPGDVYVGSDGRIFCPIVAVNHGGTGKRPPEYKHRPGIYVGDIILSDSAMAEVIAHVDSLGIEHN